MRSPVRPVLLVDFLDSFTSNVAEWLAHWGCQVTVKSFKSLTAPGVLSSYLDRTGSAVCLSPGPRAPADVLRVWPTLGCELAGRPVLGLCLGHQILATLQGAAVVGARVPRHGTTRRIFLRPDPLLGAHGEVAMAAYNSLTVAVENGGVSGVRVIARCEAGEVQALAWDAEPLWLGFQFHPESFLSPRIDLIAGWRAAMPQSAAGPGLVPDGREAVAFAR